MKNIAIGTGRRKTAVARVYIREGKGTVTVNNKDINAYFATPEQVQQAKQPLMVTSSDAKYDIIINVYGGGLNGQAGACSHGIARALTQVDVSNHTSLKANGLLTRDSRMVERKKYGQRGARRKFQFSKR
ncbi:30S ribosomal protein S9 [Treponema phagedenis]|uniref:Small ribosomal subunit protein uS9 n=1 Tax=Treponema phagedenis TaxID=162 RepID=A0A0B7GPX1_TREPH|nr:30S ribosomal protein S9 [Treponema phagedenis]NVP23375.1 30S ribosomal protein S9 [Treponema phagedenis]QKS92813.1 30S ribosomal protein S9 [Treponema phagedenis]QLC58225.1 30S ribosomal protein S9 [Treponema phagedenis]CEM60624.1 30S ribosomal subunit protein S9 [Treponema phagedenis]